MKAHLYADLPVEIVELEDEAATAALAGWLAGFARPGDCIVLSGELGAGKTALARAFLRAATGDAERVVAWVDSGRRPHEGDPVSAGDLGRLLDAAAGAGLRHFIYHHQQNLTAGEWAVISQRCGTPWQSRGTPPLTAALESDSAAMPGYYPPDKAVL